MTKLNTLEILRTAKGLTQEEIATRIGVAVSTYSMYANGHRMIPRQIAERIAYILDCKLEEIFLPEKFTVSKTSEDSGRSPPAPAEVERERAAFERREITLNELRVKYGLPAIKSGYMDQKLVQLD